MNVGLWKMFHCGSYRRCYPLGNVAYEPETNAKGERLIWLERVWADKLGACACRGRATAT
jgi:hypothetical protein